MTVYGDNMRAPYGRMLMCHLIADGHQELLRMVDRIGVDRRWIQRGGTQREHFDISLGKRKLAVANGAKEITSRDLCYKINVRDNPMGGNDDKDQK